MILMKFKNTDSTAFVVPEVPLKMLFKWYFSKCFIIFTFLLKCKINI